MKELTQNLKVSLQEIGELSALLYVHLTIQAEELTGWKVFRNYADEGCDLVIMGPGKQINLEVKTRQTLLVSQHPNQAHFTITRKEKELSHFVLAYWFNKSTFFIVPTEELYETKSNGTVLYKFIARYSEINSDFTDGSRQYAHDWKRITNAIQAIDLGK
ncbi:MAG: hypothetical protein IPH22_07935 [Nitrosomonas sp.]|nr:hypothetical protein [Nitrosomonas sp.]